MSSVISYIDKHMAEGCCGCSDLDLKEVDFHSMPDQYVCLKGLSNNESCKLSNKSL